RTREPDRFFTISGFTNDFEISLHGKQSPQTFAEKRLVINQKNFDWFHAGRLTSNENPLPASVLTRTAPLRSWTLSRTPSKPKPSELVLPRPSSVMRKRTRRSSR